MEKEILLLSKLGLSETEAKVYLTILQKGKLTGYEASKLTGVSRSKIYNFLESLIQKGFLIYQVNANSTIYSAVPIKQITDKIQHEMDSVVDEAVECLTAYPHINDMNELWHIRSRENIFAKCRHIIEETKEELLLQIWEKDIDEILDELQELQEKGVNMGIVVFSPNKELELPLKNYYRHGMVEQKKGEMGGPWINLVSDEEQVIFGQIAGEELAEVIWSKSNPMIFLASEYVKHDLYFYKSATAFQHDMEDEYGSDLEKIRDIF